MIERRKDHRQRRNQRLAAGGFGTVLSSALSQAIVAFWGANWNPEKVAAIVAICSAVVTGATICFSDIHELIGAALRKRLGNGDEQQ